MLPVALSLEAPASDFSFPISTFQRFPLRPVVLWSVVSSRLSVVRGPWSHFRFHLSAFPISAFSLAPSTAFVHSPPAPRSAFLPPALAFRLRTSVFSLSRYSRSASPQRPTRSPTAESRRTGCWPKPPEIGR